MGLTKISDSKDVWEYDVSGAEGIDNLNTDDPVWHVVFSNPGTGDKSARDLFSAQGTCTVTVAKGYEGEDDVTISDDSGNTATDHIVFGSAEEEPAVTNEEE
jgi:hypothetical protein